MDGERFTELLDKFESENVEGLLRVTRFAMRTPSHPAFPDYSVDELLSKLEFADKQQKILLQTIKYLQDKPYLNFFDTRVAQIRESVHACEELQEAKASMGRHLWAKVNLMGWRAPERLTFSNAQERLIQQLKEGQTSLKFVQEMADLEENQLKSQGYAFTFVKGLHMIC